MSFVHVFQLLFSEHKPVFRFFLMLSRQAVHSEAKLVSDIKCSF